jgi:hypothetical protein
LVDRDDLALSLTKFLGGFTHFVIDLAGPTAAERRLERYLGRGTDQTFPARSSNAFGTFMYSVEWQRVA